MRPQRKIMMVETTHAFVKLKQIKAAVSAGGIKFDWKYMQCGHVNARTTKHPPSTKNIKQTWARGAQARCTTSSFP